MRSPPPIYQAQDRTYFIDTCRPQLQAIREGRIEFHALSHGHYPGTLLNRDVLQGISTIGYWDAVGEQNWGLEAHRNEGIEVVLLETGATPFVVDGQCHDLRAGDLTITRPWQLHRLGDPHLGPGRIHWFVLDVGVRRPDQPWHWPSWVCLTREDREELTARLRQNERPVWPSTPEIRHDFQALAEAIRLNRRRSHLSTIIVHLNHLLLNLLILLRRQKVPRDPGLTTREHTVALFLADLKANPAGLAHPWTLQEMATLCGMGVTSFVKYCRSKTNASPLAYLNRCRLEHAARRLREEPQTPVTTIAFDCGFSSSQHFAVRFHRCFGCSPTTFRSRARREVSAP